MEGKENRGKRSAVYVLMANTVGETQREIIAKFMHVKSFWKQMVVLSLSPLILRWLMPASSVRYSPRSFCLWYCFCFNCLSFTSAFQTFLLESSTSCHCSIFCLLLPGLLFLQGANFWSVLFIVPTSSACKLNWTDSAVMDEVGTASGSNVSVHFCALSLSFYSPSHLSGGTMMLSLEFETGEGSLEAFLELRTALSKWYCTLQLCQVNLWWLGTAAGLL